MLFSGTVAHAETRAACILNFLRNGQDTYFAEDALTAEQIHYRVYGRGKPDTIVLVHGLGGDLSTWDEIAPELANRFQVIVYDQRGHGLTPERGHNFSSTMLAHDLKTLLDSLGVGKVHLLGHSMGGRTVMKFAALFGEQTRSVIVEDMHFIGRTKALADPSLFSRELATLVDVDFPDVETAIRTAEERLGPLSVEDLDRYGLRRLASGRFAFLRVNPSVPHYSAQGLQEDLTQSLVSARAPVLLLAADPGSGAVLFGKGLDHALANRPDAEVVIFEGTGHGIHGERPEGFLSAVTGFLRKVGP